MKKIFLLLIVLLLSLTAVSAIEIEIEAIKDNIYLTESAEFKIIIKNDNNSIQNFNVYSPEVEWNIPSKQIKAYPQISTEETLEVIPTKYIGPGMYGIKLNFRNQDTNELIEKIIFVNVKSPGEAFSQYKPSIKISISSESAIDPGSDVLVTVTLENKNILDLKDIILRITSTDEIFDIEQNISLKPYSS